MEKPDPQRPDKERRPGEPEERIAEVWRIYPEDGVLTTGSHYRAVERGEDELSIEAVDKDDPPGAHPKGSS